MNQLTPPFQHPIFDQNGQLTIPWRNFFDELAKAVNKLNEVNNGP